MSAELLTILVLLALLDRQTRRYEHAKDLIWRITKRKISYGELRQEYKRLP